MYDKMTKKEYLFLASETIQTSDQNDNSFL